MNKALAIRLGKLEASKRQRRTFVVWEGPGVDVKAARERLKRDEAMKESDLLLVVSWLS